MNFYPFRWIIPSSWWGEGYHFARWLKKQTPFRWSHFDIIAPNIKADKVILCFGQIHTVPRGKLSYFTCRKIATVQARLFTYYSFLHENKVIESFGVEGLTDIHKSALLKYNNESLAQNISPREMKQLETKGKDMKAVKNIFIRLAKKWHQLLKRFPNTPQEVAPIANLIDGLRMLALFDPQLTIYPIEGEQEYQYVAKNIGELQNTLYFQERSPEMVKAKQKKYKNLTEEEYKAVKDYQSTVKKYNALLKAPIREEAHISLALRQLETRKLTAFVMGIGHRYNLLFKAKNMLKKQNTVFIFITPQELWLWKAIVMWIKRLFLLGIIAGIIWLYFWFSR